MQTTYTVAGMSCSHCEASVREEVTEIAGVTAVAIDHTTGELVITSDAPIDSEAVAAAIDEAGFSLA